MHMDQIVFPLPVDVLWRRGRLIAASPERRTSLFSFSVVVKNLLKVEKELFFILLSTSFLTFNIFLYMCTRTNVYDRSSMGLYFRVNYEVIKEVTAIRCPRL